MREGGKNFEDFSGLVVGEHASGRRISVSFA